MSNRFVALAVVIAGVIAAIPGAAAHHSDVAYDQTKRVTLSGAKVINFVWQNPHGILVLEVKDDAGVSQWTLETGSPSSLSRTGWTRNSLTAGDIVTATANTARNGTKFGRMLDVTKADGTVLVWEPAGVR